jgi:hypothetical protein
MKQQIVRVFGWEWEGGKHIETGVNDMIAKGWRVVSMVSNAPATGQEVSYMGMLVVLFEK